LSTKAKKTAAVKKTVAKKAQKATAVKTGKRVVAVKAAAVSKTDSTEKTQKVSTTKVVKKETSRVDPECWTIVESESKSIKDRHAASVKSTSENHTSHIIITYNQRKTTMVTHPDTQAQATIINDYRNVKQFKEGQVTLTGIDQNNSMETQTVNLSFVLETVEDKQYRLDIDGIYAPDTSVIVMTYEDLRKVGLKVDYDSGKIVAPDGQIIRMRIQDTVWTIPVMMEE
jgi:uncharacterized protein (DUF1786 family)